MTGGNARDRAAPSETNPRCYRREAGALVVTVRLTPKSSRDAIDGIATLSDGTAIARARVRALPEDGAANAALVALFARTLAVPKSAVTLLSGGKARLKQLRVEGDSLRLAQIVDAWLTLD